MLQGAMGGFLAGISGAFVLVKLLIRAAVAELRNSLNEEFRAFDRRLTSLETARGRH
jgi:hypothetical protein